MIVLRPGAQNSTQSDKTKHFLARSPDTIQISLTWKIFANLLLEVTGVRPQSLLALIPLVIRFGATSITIIWSDVRYRKGVPVEASYPLTWDEFPGFWPAFKAFVQDLPKRSPIFGVLKNSDGVCKCVRWVSSFVKWTSTPTTGSIGLWRQQGQEGDLQVAHA